MTKLRIPSLQHLARHWRPEPQRVKRSLIELAENTPTFNYNALFGAVRDMLMFHQPYDEIVEGIKRGIKRQDVRENLLSVLPLIRDYFDNVSPAFVQAVDRRFYPVGRDLLVPFDPPIIYGLEGQLYFPWFSFWRSNPLTADRLSLFVTMVEEVMLQDPDLENAKFTILDFSAPNPKSPRKLKIIDSHDIPRISAIDKAEMLHIFATGYAMARDELAGKTPSSTKNRYQDKGLIDDHPDLFR
jgi:hypothetical protein